MKIVTVAQMHQIEDECASLGISTRRLMENAGRAVADRVAKLLSPIDGRQILVMAGPGNNGGDGLVAARTLYEQGAQVSVFMPCERPRSDPDLKQLEELGVIPLTNPDELRALFPRLDGIIDALLGTGISRPVSGCIREGLISLIELKNKRPEVPLFAIDVPSGLNADTGEVDPSCPRVDYTLSLGAAKPGLFIAPGIEKVGKVEIVDIGIPETLFPSSSPEIITPHWATTVLPQRPPAAHKGTFGRVMVIAGSLNYTGAAYLACAGAMRTGAGRVTLAAPASLLPVLATKLTEATHLPLSDEDGYISPAALIQIRENIEDFDAVLLGCGLSRRKSVVSFVDTLIEHLGPIPAVIDADALNILSEIPEWWTRLTAPAVLTPHPGELARLTGLSTSEVLQRRLELPKSLAQQWQKVVVLKGAYTVVAAPSGRLRVNPIASAALASAGTGDVLAGVIAGLLAQGLSPFEAACLGVFIHGRAGEKAGQTIGEFGTLAGDLLPLLPQVIKNLKEMRE